MVRTENSITWKDYWANAAELARSFYQVCVRLLLISNELWGFSGRFNGRLIPEMGVLPLCHL